MVIHLLILIPTSDFLLPVHPIVYLDVEVLDVWNTYLIVPMKHGY